MSRLTGRITMAQEQRFRLIVADGRGFLLTVTPGAGVSAGDLQRWQASGAVISVDYTGEANTITGAVQSARELSQRS